MDRIEQAGKTHLTMHTIFKSALELEKSVNEYGALEGGISTLGRLEDQLPMVQFHHVQDNVFVVERILNAPRELVFKVFSEAEHLSKWWDPEGWTMPVCNLDFRVGGRWHYCMRSIDGQMESWGLSIYQEIIDPEKIVQVDSFSDETGVVNESMPSAIITTSFIGLGLSKTRVICSTAYASADQVKTVLEMGILQGLTESWNRLVRHLDSIESIS